MNFKKNLYIVCCIITSLLECAKNDQFTIMIDPAGDAKHTGRLIVDTLERGISLQFAQALKERLSKLFTNIRIVITRVSGETIQPLQNASFANRLNVDLYLSLYFYHELQTPCHITIYYYLEHPVTDQWHVTKELTWYHVHQAHLINLEKTKIWGQSMLETFTEKKWSKFFMAHGLIGMPFLPLIGIKAPALALEVGLQNKKDWQMLIDPLVAAIEKIIP